MRKHKIFCIIAFILVIAAPVFLYAAPLTRSFGVGSKIIAGPTQLQTAITCAATYGPFLMRPYNIATPGPYFIRTTTRGTPKLNGYFLGLYNLVPDTGTCFNPETGAPIPAFEIKPSYGVSR